MLQVQCFLEFEEKKTPTEIQCRIFRVDLGLIPAGPAVIITISRGSVQNFEAEKMSFAPICTSSLQKSALNCFQNLRLVFFKYVVAWFIITILFALNPSESQTAEEQFRSLHPNRLKSCNMPSLRDMCGSGIEVAHHEKL